jgi:hypothetical protein
MDSEMITAIVISAAVFVCLFLDWKVFYKDKDDGGKGFPHSRGKR